MYREILTYLNIRKELLIELTDIEYFNIDYLYEIFLDTEDDGFKYKFKHMFIKETFNTILSSDETDTAHSLTKRIVTELKNELYKISPRDVKSIYPNDYNNIIFIVESLKGYVDGVITMYIGRKLRRIGYNEVSSFNFKPYYIAALDMDVHTENTYVASVAVVGLTL